MKIIVLGNNNRAKELPKSIKKNTIEWVKESDPAADLIIDFDLPENIESIKQYPQEVPVLLNSPFFSPAELENKNIAIFNGLEGLFNPSAWEVAANEKLPAAIQNFFSEAAISYELLSPRVGMVTPRVVCMIINEAYYTVQEGTATEEDIDMGMKLGTGYPYGPFEWKNIIGIKNVYTLLNRMFEDTKEERYKICPLLKKEYLSSI